MDGAAEAKIEWIYVDAKSALLRPHGILNTPIPSIVDVMASAQLLGAQGKRLRKLRGPIIVRQ
jgi:hypothetical protein